VIQLTMKGTLLSINLRTLSPLSGDTHEVVVRFGGRDWDVSMTTQEGRRRGLTQISDTISDHDTLQVDLGFAMLLELEIPVRNSRSKERKVSTLH